MRSVFSVLVLVSMACSNVIVPMDLDNNQRICLSMDDVAGLVPEHPELKLEEEWWCYCTDIEIYRSPQDLYENDNACFDNPRTERGTVMGYQPLTPEEIENAIFQYEKNYVQYLKSFKDFVSFLKMLDQNYDVRDIQPLAPTETFIPKVKTERTAHYYWVYYQEENNDDECLKKREKHEEIKERLFEMYKTLRRELVSRR